jgi:hypothetical protein
MNMDESFLALNVADRSYPDLLKPLDYNQGAAPGFLIAQKAIVQALGNHDYSHALIPFICGLLLLFLMLQFTKRFAVGTGILVSLGIFVVSGPILRYSSRPAVLAGCVAL